MTFAETLKENNIDLNNKKLVTLMQDFYQNGYLQGANDGSPNYKYHVKYYEIVARLLDLFKLTRDPISLDKLKLCLDNLDEFRKGNLI
jgi:hypothetical protein